MVLKYWLGYSLGTRMVTQEWALQALLVLDGHLNMVNKQGCNNPAYYLRTDIQVWLNQGQALQYQLE